MCELVVKIDASTFLAVHGTEGSRSEEPLENFHAALSERVVEVLQQASAEPVD
jgi:hypothetical protein